MILGEVQSTVRIIASRNNGGAPRNGDLAVLRATRTIDDMRPENAKYDRLVRLWQRLPVMVTGFVGPRIVRGITLKLCTGASNGLYHVSNPADTPRTAVTVAVYDDGGGRINLVSVGVLAAEDRCCWFVR